MKLLIIPQELLHIIFKYTDTNTLVSIDNQFAIDLVYERVKIVVTNLISRTKYSDESGTMLFGLDELFDNNSQALLVFSDQSQQISLWYGAESDVEDYNPITQQDERLKVLWYGPKPSIEISANRAYVCPINYLALKGNNDFSSQQRFLHITEVNITATSFEELYPDNQLPRFKLVKLKNK